MNYPEGNSHDITFLLLVTATNRLNICSLLYPGISSFGALVTKQASIDSSPNLLLKRLKPKGITMFLCGIGMMFTVSKSEKYKSLSNLGSY